MITGKLVLALQSVLRLVKAVFHPCTPKRCTICLTAGFLLILIWSITSMMSVAFAKNDDCDPSLEQPNENPYGYRQRGDRCEGQYIKQVASTTLLVASFTEAFGEFDHSSNKDLVVEWRTFGSKQIRLRAHGLKRKLYYRMDTVRSPEAQIFNWPVGLLAALTIPRQSIGVVGWTHYSIGGVEKEVYLPLRINQTKAVSQSGIYTAVLLPGVELSEVYVSLATVGTNGHPENFLRDGIALGNNYYPADRPIDISISGLKAPGLYYLEIGATLKTGGSATVEFWFHHPG
ncbi:MAG: hypothetical protein JNN16_09260 [Nitrospira sp.]|nr:hypothetical protein [Nitrospira sp.]